MLAIHTHIRQHGGCLFLLTPSFVWCVEAPATKQAIGLIGLNDFIDFIRLSALGCWLWASYSSRPMHTGTLECYHHARRRSDHPDLCAPLGTIWRWKAGALLLLLSLQLV